MNKNNRQASTPRVNLSSTSLQEFLLTEKVALNDVARAFIKQHEVTTIGELLEVSLIQEPAKTLQAISPLREALRRRQITTHRYKFLMSYI